MGYEYYCVFCGFHEPAEPAGATDGLCQTCGGALRRATSEQYAVIAAALDIGRLDRRARFDGAIPLLALIVAPWLIGVEDALLVVGGLFLVMGAALASRASRRAGEKALAWNLYAAAALAGVVALGLAALETSLTFCAGAAATLLLAGGLAAHTHARFTWASPDRMLAASLLVAPVTVAVSVFVVADAPLRPAGAVVCGLVALWCAAILSGCGRRAIDKLLGLRLLGVAAGALAACAVAAVDGPHAVHVAATLLAVTGWLLTDAAVDERPAPTIADVRPGATPDRAPGAAPAPAA
jgi:hypothetical protein